MSHRDDEYSYPVDTRPGVPLSGLVVALPVSLAMWALIVWAVL